MPGGFNDWHHTGVCEPKATALMPFLDLLVAYFLKHFSFLSLGQCGPNPPVPPPMQRPR